MKCSPEAGLEETAANDTNDFFPVFFPIFWDAPNILELVFGNSDKTKKTGRILEMLNIANCILHYSQYL
jgi:hypothetical protein